MKKSKHYDGTLYVGLRKVNSVHELRSITNRELLLLVIVVIEF